MEDEIDELCGGLTTHQREELRSLKEGDRGLVLKLCKRAWEQGLRDEARMRKIYADERAAARAARVR